MYDHLTTVSRHMNTLGWANYANDHEDANGQFEQNFRYADPLTTADRVIVFRYMVHSLAAEAGMLATFMPKPFSHLTGNGLHMHLSLWDAESEGDELFADPEDGRGLGMSALGYSFIGGLLEHAEALAAVACPTVNSYKRLASRATEFGCGVVAGVCHLWRQRPHAHAAGARSRPGGGPLHRRFGQPVPGHERADRGRARRHRAWRGPRRPLRAQPLGARASKRQPTSGCGPCP